MYPKINIKFYALILCIAILAGGCAAGIPEKLVFDKMLVEYAESPINLDVLHPRFSWVVRSSERGSSQSAYRILVGSSKEGLDKGNVDIWDSGKIRSNETIQHPFPVKLKSNSGYFWKVMIWNEDDELFESGISRFGTAILDDNLWEANWIGKGPAKTPLPEKGFFGHQSEERAMVDTVHHDGRSLLLRRELNVPRKVKSAKAYISGLGFYEFYINGKRVGDHVLAPAKSPYQKHILYDTYDVTHWVKNGKNALGIHLGNGWYNPYKPWWQQYRMQWFGHKKAFMQLVLTYTDGSTDLVVTDENWKWADGPILYNCIYDGEVYDARLEESGWNDADFNDQRWNKVTVMEKPPAQLVSHRMPAIKVTEIIEPKEIAVGTDNLRVFDMGQNFTGWVKIRAKGETNTKISIRFAEDIHPDGTIDRTSAEQATATAEYIMKGNGSETYEPAFTYFGFKYVEVVADQPIELEHIEGHVIHTANTPSGDFSCSNELVNRIHRATVWSQKSNMLGYPMDCPQRDERLGWFGDAQVSAEQAMFNFDMALFFGNWFDGIRDNQDQATGDIPIISPQPYFLDEGVEWSSTYIIMLWQYYQYYGDTAILRRHYPAMKKYIRFLDSIAVDRIVPMGWIGDWGSMTEGWVEGNPRSIPTAYYYYDAGIMAKIAELLEEKNDAAFYSGLAKDIKRAYNKEYLNNTTGNYLAGTQMDNAFPLFLDLVPEEQKQKVLDNLVEDIEVKNDTHLTTGVLGTKYMPEALAQYGRFDVAWEIINQKTYPSWNDMMCRHTTTCEFWTLKQSKNHVMMGSIDAWFYKYLAGIQLDEAAPAYAHFFIRPETLSGLDYAEAELDTYRGRIVSSWKKTDGEFHMEVEVPFNTSATISLPGTKEAVILESGKPLKQFSEIKNMGYEEGEHTIKVPSGRYSFTVEPN